VSINITSTDGLSDDGNMDSFIPWRLINDEPDNSTLQIW
jgi:hypothetical protein